MAKLTAEVVQKEENENKEGESSPMIQLGNLTGNESCKSVQIIYDSFSPNKS